MSSGCANATVEAAGSGTQGLVASGNLNAIPVDPGRDAQPNREFREDSRMAELDGRTGWFRTNG